MKFGRRDESEDEDDEDDLFFAGGEDEEINFSSNNNNNMMITGRQKGIDVIKELKNLCLEHEEGASLENLAIELNSFKFSQNASYVDCNRAAVLAAKENSEEKVGDAGSAMKIIMEMRSSLEKWEVLFKVRSEGEYASLRSSWLWAAVVVKLTIFIHSLRKKNKKINYFLGAEALTPRRRPGGNYFGIGRYLRREARRTGARDPPALRIRGFGGAQRGVYTELGRKEEGR